VDAPQHGHQGALAPTSARKAQWTRRRPSRLNAVCALPGHCENTCEALCRSGWEDSGGGGEGNRSKEPRQTMQSRAAADMKG